jgi:shikimate kinase
VSIVLIGYRCSGKTSVGRKLAERLGLSFADSDEVLVGRAGKSIRHIFAEQGEAAFRDLETAVVRELASKLNYVIALGGGALGRPENRKAIQEGKHQVIYLRCEPPELLRRIESDPATVESRPALTKLGGGIEEIEKLLAQREPIWRQMCGGELDVTDLTIEQVVEEVAKLA